MSTKRERIDNFRGLLGKLVKVPKKELEQREARAAAKRKPKKAAKKRKK